MKGMTLPAKKNLRLAVTAAALITSLGGCATGRGDARDPYEGFNRGVFSFNESVDKAVLKPVAQGYEAVVPAFARSAVGNFFANIADVFIGVNNLLQGKLQDGGSDFGRVAINTTFGIAGLFDVASGIGIDKHNEDFGQTLGKWGVGDGAYLVLPILGPRTTRDAMATVVDLKADPVGYLYPVDHRNTLIGTRLVSDRAEFLPAEKAIEEAALGDKYAYIKDAYLQRRRNMIFDGRPPRDKDDEYVPDAPAK